MKVRILILVLVFCFSCKEKKQEVPIFQTEERIVEPIDSILFNEKKSLIKIDFNVTPVNIKQFTLNDTNFWITSSMIDSMYFNGEFCNYKNYHLQRNYYIVDKESDNYKNLLKVYVTDDDNKWNRETAKEELKEIILRDASIKLWDKIHVGMSVDSLRLLIENAEYHEDLGIYRLYSEHYEASFYYRENLIDSIQVSRRYFSEEVSNLYSKYFKPVGLDSIYVISNQKQPSFYFADFNGDKKRDVVFLIKNMINNKKGLIFFHLLSDYYIIGCGDNKSALEEVNYDNFRVDKSKTAYETINDSVDGDVIGHKEIKLKNIALAMKETERTSGLLTWDGEKYIYIHTGD